MGNSKILVVDDDPDLTQAMKAILEGAGYSMVTACDKLEGMERLRSEKPDLAILDVMMSTWQDGFEMSREVRGEEDLKDIPILMLTAVRDRTGIDFRSNAGDPTWLPVDSFLEKPVDREVLLIEIDNLLSQSS